MRLASRLTCSCALESRLAIRGFTFTFTFTFVSTSTSTSTLLPLFDSDIDVYAIASRAFADALPARPGALSFIASLQIPP